MIAIQPGRWHCRAAKPSATSRTGLFLAATARHELIGRCRRRRCVLPQSKRHPQSHQGKEKPLKKQMVNRAKGRRIDAELLLTPENHFELIGFQNACNAIARVHRPRSDAVEFCVGLPVRKRLSRLMLPLVR